MIGSRLEEFDHITASTEALSSPSETYHHDHLEIPDGMLAMLAKRNREYKKRGSFKLSNEEMPEGWPVRSWSAENIDIIAPRDRLNELEKLKARVDQCSPVMMLDENTDIPFTFLNSTAKWHDVKARVYKSMSRFGILGIAYMNLRQDTIKKIAEINHLNAEHEDAPDPIPMPPHNFVILLPTGTQSNCDRLQSSG